MRIYFDHNATTPVDPAVADAVDRAVRDAYGNPSSVHHFGQQTKQLLDEARGRVADLIGGQSLEIVFTAGGTESDNLAIRGVAEVAEPAGRRHVIASAFEHEAVLNTVKALGRRGWRTTLLPVDEHGLVSPDRLTEAIDDETALVSIMFANNEIGTIQPIAQLAAIAHARGAIFHTDAVQAVGKVPVDVRSMEVDLLSLSGHKFNGPKGVGALWIRRGTRLAAQLTGGRQERSRRAGTENVPALVGLGLAATLAGGKLEQAGELAALRDRLETGILAGVPQTRRNGIAAPRVPNTANISFEGVEAESLLIALDLEGVAVSTGSACSSGTLEPSHVLKAMGLAPHRIQSSIRFSLGGGNTTEQVDRVVALLPGIVDRLRSLVRPGARR